MQWKETHDEGMVLKGRRAAWPYPAQPPVKKKKKIDVPKNCLARHRPDDSYALYDAELLQG